MRRSSFSVVWLAIAIGASAQPTSALKKTESSKAAGPAVQRVTSPNAPRTALAIRVPDAPMVFTGQIFAESSEGDARSQSEHSLDALAATLAKAGSDLARVVRLNAYVGDDKIIPIVESAVSARFESLPPAFTLVRTPLTKRGALVGFEAVALSSRTLPTVDVVDRNAAILPAGGKVFISGQAERGADLATATRLTMAGLQRSLDYAGLKWSDVVQVKAFIKPFSDHESARREIAASFGGAGAPPVVLIEWVSELFAEIELVVSSRALPAKPDESIRHTWLPWLTKSPRYCHVVFVEANTPLIFIGAVHGGDTQDPRTQMKTIFERLGSVLFEAGSSYRNLAKATYYLADPTARSLLGDLRAVYFDPTRPPAASALNVNGLGYEGRAVMFDLIAVPVK